MLNENCKSVHVSVGISLRTGCREAGAPVTWVLKTGPGEGADGGLEGKEGLRGWERAALRWAETEAPLHGFQGSKPALRWAWQGGQPCLPQGQKPSPLFRVANLATGDRDLAFSF